MSSNKITYSTGEGYSLSHYSKIVEAGTKLQYAGEFLGLHFNLCNELHYEITNILTGSIAKNQYNLIYLPPHSPYTFTLQQHGMYSAIDIQFTPDYLSLFDFKYPRFKLFLTSPKFPLVLSLAHLPISPAMFENIDAILYNKYTGLDRDAYIKTKVKEITLCCLEHIRAVSIFLTGSNPQRDIAVIQGIYDYLRHNLQNACSMSHLAYKANMDEKKLEKGFKLCFGTTIYDFHLNKRLEKAAVLLRNTQMHVKDIATEIGYKNVSNFCEVFKQKYHYSPRALRLNSMEKEEHKPVVE